MVARAASCEWLGKGTGEAGYQLCCCTRYLGLQKGKLAARTLHDKLQDIVIPGSRMTEQQMK